MTDGTVIAAIAPSLSVSSSADANSECIRHITMLVDILYHWPIPINYVKTKITNYNSDAPKIGLTIENWLISLLADASELLIKYGMRQHYYFSMLKGAYCIATRLENYGLDISMGQHT